MLEINKNVYIPARRISAHLNNGSDSSRFGEAAERHCTRGAGAFGYFECLKDMSAFTSASFLQKVGRKSPVLSFFSSKNITKSRWRAVRNFSVKFYTAGGNFDLIGHSMAPFATEKVWSLAAVKIDTLASTLWAMSDRALPRSYRTIEGFAAHSFRLVNKNGDKIYARFRWKPVLAGQGMSWEECRQLGDFDADHNRRDLWDEIRNGRFPVWELGVQLIPESQALHFPFNLRDCTKIIPEALVPMTTIGRMTLNRNPDNFFAEFDPASFNPHQLVDGIDLETSFGDSPQRGAESLSEPIFQAQLFFNSQTDIEKKHIESALVSEMMAESSLSLRENVLKCLHIVDKKLAEDVADSLGMPYCKSTESGSILSSGNAPRLEFFKAKADTPGE